MRKATVLIVVALFALALPSMAARVANVPLTHPNADVFQAYCGETCDGVGNQCFAGAALTDDVIEAVPGILCIEPGGATNQAGEFVIDWRNFVSAYGQIAYTVTNTTLRKTVPDPAYVCTVPIGGLPALQQGTANIRRWWPLMYEVPGTKWTLTITYKTAVWDDDGAGPNLPATTHQDVWTWTVAADFTSLRNLIVLFHELPVGSCQIPLISSEWLYGELLKSVDQLAGMVPTDPEMSEVFNTFIMLLSDYCVTVDCSDCGSMLGIRNTLENPACCKLLADADFIAEKLGVNIAGK